jgi:hypothetical protein
VNKDNDPKLFYALPWSYGTVGFLTSVERTNFYFFGRNSTRGRLAVSQADFGPFFVPTVKIIPVKPYVHMTYIPTFSDEELKRKVSSNTLGTT